MSILAKPMEIAAIRGELGLTQSELADLLGVSARTVQSCEQGWRQPGAAVEKALLLHLMMSRRGAELVEAKCWEHVGCSEDARVRCPVYRSRQGHLCWMLTGNLCCGEQGRVDDWEDKKSVCANCRFFDVLTADRARTGS